LINVPSTSVATRVGRAGLVGRSGLTPPLCLSGTTVSLSASAIDIPTLLIEQKVGHMSDPRGNCCLSGNQPRAAYGLAKTQTTFRQFRGRPTPGCSVSSELRPALQGRFSRALPAPPAWPTLTSWHWHRHRPAAKHRSNRQGSWSTMGSERNRTTCAGNTPAWGYST
jgi:hypothetical protein